MNVSEQIEAIRERSESYQMRIDRGFYQQSPEHTDRAELLKIVDEQAAEIESLKRHIQSHLPHTVSFAVKVEK